MIKPENIQETIESFEEMLKRYKEDLGKNPGSFFYEGLVKNTEEYIEELNEELEKVINRNPASVTGSKKINEATSTDIPIIMSLVDDYGWKLGDTLLYQQTYEHS